MITDGNNDIGAMAGISAGKLIQAIITRAKTPETVTLVGNVTLVEVMLPALSVRVDTVQSTILYGILVGASTGGTSIGPVGASTDRPVAPSELEVDIKQVPVRAVDLPAFLSGRVLTDVFCVQIR